MKSPQPTNSIRRWPPSKTLAGVRLFTASLVLLTQIETAASNQCVVALNGRPSQILHERDPKLHLSLGVEKTSLTFYRENGVRLVQPADKIEAWLSSLNSIAVKAQKSPRAYEQIKEILFKKFVIKEDEVPQGYYNLQVRLAREAGHGTINLDSAQKHRLATTLIRDQELSLERWIKYFISPDSASYPMWMKYWMFTGMTKLSKYNPETGTYGTRTNETVAPFPELNREALGAVANLVLKKLNKKALSEIKDPGQRQLIDGMNFGKIYGSTLHKLGFGTAKSFKTNEGQWILYPQGSDHMPLVNSLEGHNTGWCTASAATAADQLENGNFHVYYSNDEAGHPKIPRVAIRMNENAIAEVRGVGPEQNLDSQIQFSEVVPTKLKEFGPEAQIYAKKETDMRTLTVIDTKVRLGEALSSEDLSFLYEVDHEIEGFGYEKDPRVSEILRGRDKSQDLHSLFPKFKASEIATDERELDGSKKMFFGDLDFVYSTPERLKGLEYVHGSLSLDRVPSLNGIDLPRRIKKNLSMYSVETLAGAQLPLEVHGSFLANNLKSLEGQMLPAGIKVHLALPALKNLENTPTLPAVERISLHNVTKLENVKIPDSVKVMYLSQCTELKNVDFPAEMTELFLPKLTKTTGVVLPKITPRP